MATRKGTILGVGLLLLLGLLAAACTPAAQPTATPSTRATAAPGTTPAAAQGEPGGTIRLITYGEPPHQDVHQSLLTNIQGEGFGQAYSGLLMYKWGPDVAALDSIPVGDLAEKWENPDPTTYIFYLRKGVKFHNIAPVNGREFVADDVVFSHTRQATKGWPNAPYVDMVKTWEAPDKYTVKATLDKPNAGFLTIFASGYNKIVAKELVEKDKDLKNSPHIGTGPFIQDEFQKDVMKSLKKNPDFYVKGQPLVDKVEFYIITDDSARQAAFQTGKIDRYGFSTPIVKALTAANPKLVKKEYKGSYGGFNFGLKVSQKPFDDERVRDAISLALDRQAFIDTVQFGMGWFSQGITLPKEDWLLPQEEFAKAWKRDVPKAKQLLAEAGYPNGFDSELTVAYTYGQSYISGGELFQSQLKDVGINVTIKNVDSPTYVERVIQRGTTGGEFKMYLGPLGAAAEASAELYNTYHSTGGRNVSGHNDPKLDKMIDDQSQELNAEKRKAMIMEIERYLLDKNYKLFIASSTSQTLVQPWLQGWAPYAGGDSHRAAILRTEWVDSTSPSKKK